MPKTIYLFCKPASFNWHVLPELPSRLAKAGLSVKSYDISIRRYPTNIEYDSMEEALNDVRANGEPKSYEMRFWGMLNAKSFGFSRFVNLSDQEILSINLSGFGSVEDARSLADFLGLQIDSISTEKNSLEKKCFIAHRFDEVGSELADKLARFLNLLNFEVSTGRGFSPGSVSEKVKARMEMQSLVFAVMTPGDDSTWLIQESLLGSLGKPLFVLKEKTYSFKPGLLGDHEYIPFTSPTIETTFVPILEGIRDLGFTFK
jgi:hypothetical protein